MAFLYFAVFVAYVVGLWKVFTKAGEEGWKSIIPIYSTIVLLKIIGRPWWWILLLLVPIFLPFIFTMILGFGTDRCLGPGGSGMAGGFGTPTTQPPPPPPAPTF